MRTPLQVRIRAKATSSTAPLGFDDLVEAFFAERKWRSAHPLLAEYFKKRRQLLERSLGCRLAAEEPSSQRQAPANGATDAERAQDRRAVASVALSCLELSARLGSPFGHHMEGCPGPLEVGLLEEHHAPLERAQGELEQRYRALFAAALARLFPHAVHRRTSERELELLGLPAQPDIERFEQR